MSKYTGLVIILLAAVLCSICLAEPANKHHRLDRLYRRLVRNPGAQDYNSFAMDPFLGGDRRYKRRGAGAGDQQLNSIEDRIFYGHPGRRFRRS
ncbi:hypothetical protein BOX15_Mlig030967g1 [Macrostomum lignano]|uniref:Uncharacterized protein n=2 Tax=Macrostomum lignano TaxID=282301 RepID=A0A267F4C7_9PLAT|nr:hypothetical protein BOX15_Mlig030967g1 [Macrostomum lignano]